MTTFGNPKTTVSETIQQPLTLEVNLYKMHEAIGELFWDSYCRGFVIYGLETDLNLVSQDCEQILGKRMANCRFKTKIKLMN